MTETKTEAAAGTPATPKAKKGKSASSAAAGAKKSKNGPSHPPVSAMVTAAIRSLKERGGSSTQAIKKYISSTYKIDAEKKSHFIKKHLVSAVASGSLVQTKGKGASGSFKLAGPGGEAKKASAATKPTPKLMIKPKSPKAKTAAKKAVAATKAKKIKKKPPTAAKTPKPKVTKAKLAPAPKTKKAPAKKTVAKKAPPSKKASPKKK